MRRKDRQVTDPEKIDSIIASAIAAVWAFPMESRCMWFP